MCGKSHKTLMQIWESPSQPNRGLWNKDCLWREPHVAYVQAREPHCPQSLAGCCQVGKLRQSLVLERGWNSSRIGYWGHRRAAGNWKPNFCLRFKSWDPKSQSPFWICHLNCVTWTRYLTSLGLGCLPCHLRLITGCWNNVCNSTHAGLGHKNYLPLLCIYKFLKSGKESTSALYTFHLTNISSRSTFCRTYQLCILEHGLSVFQSLASPCWCHRPWHENRPRNPLHSGTSWQFLPRINFVGPLTASSAFSDAAPEHN